MLLISLEINITLNSSIQRKCPMYMLQTVQRTCYDSRCKIKQRILPCTHKRGGSHRPPARRGYWPVPLPGPRYKHVTRYRLLPGGRGHPPPFSEPDLHPTPAAEQPISNNCLAAVRGRQIHPRQYWPINNLQNMFEKSEFIVKLGFIWAGVNVPIPSQPPATRLGHAHTAM